MNCAPIVRQPSNNWRCSFLSKFTAKEKLQAVQRYLNGNESYKDIGQSIGVNKKSIIIWVKQYEHNLLTSTG